MSPHRTIVSPSLHETRAGLTPGLTALATFMALGLAACATPAPPIEQMAVAKAAIQHATSAGASTLAPAEMSLARDKMTRAEQAAAAGQSERALALAQQAQLDAQLAEAKAEAVKSSKAADALREASRALREEMSRQTPANSPRN